MLTKAVRLYGKDDLRLEEFELPQIKEDEILAKVVSDSICMSSYKAAHQGNEHKRVPDDVAENPVIIGHEFAGEIVEVGKKWQSEFKPGDKFSIQPALTYEGGPVGVLSAPGYSYKYIGGDATYVVIPAEVMEQGCLLPYKGEGFYPAPLSEPLSCVIGAMHACYHTTPGSYVHSMEIKDGGKMALLAGVGPMGLACINYVLHREDRHPSLFVVTDIDQTRLDRAAMLYTKEFAASRGIDLRYVNTGAVENPVETLRELTGGDGVELPLRPLALAPAVLVDRDVEAGQDVVGGEVHRGRHQAAGDGFDVGAEPDGGRGGALAAHHLHRPGEDLLHGVGRERAVRLEGVDLLARQGRDEVVFCRFAPGHGSGPPVG